MDYTGIVISFVGGLALFIYGMQIMAQGLQNATGSKMKQLLEVLTRNKFMGVVLGAVVTAIIQSSSATTVMVIGFVNAGLMDLVQAMSIIMGANIGTTATGWIVASSEWAKFLSPTTIAPIVIMIGVIILLSAKKNDQKEFASILIGFGILFVGISMMSDAVYPLRESEAFKTVFLTLGSNPILGVLAGAVVTGIIQSSSASVGILQTLASSGLVPLNAGVYIIMGQNIGTCVTAMLSGIGASKNARSAAYMHLSFNIIGSIIFSVFAIVFFKLINPAVGYNLISQTEISGIHTVFNIGTTILLYPFSNYIIALAKKLNKVEDEPEEKILVHLDDRVLETPSFAVSCARQEVIRMGLIVQKNLEQSLEILIEGKKENIEDVIKRESKVDKICAALNDYLVKICSTHLSQEENLTVTNLLHIVDDVERVGDHCENIAELMKELYGERGQFSEMALEELRDISRHTFVCYCSSMKSISEEDIEAARQTVREEDIIDEIEAKLRASHIKRLAANECTANSGIAFLDVITNLERISDHALNVAQVILNHYREMKSKTKKEANIEK